MAVRCLGLLSICCAGAFVLAAGRGFAQTQRDEYEIKAAFLFNLFLYVDWPQNALPDNGTFVLGILGPDPFGDHLKELGKRNVKNRPIVFRKFPTVEDIRPCHMLFIASERGEREGPEERLAKALAKLKGAPVLIVGDTPGLAAKGAAINLLTEQGASKMEANPEAARRHGLSIRASLLKLARIVKDQETP